MSGNTSTDTGGEELEDATNIPNQSELEELQRKLREIEARIKELQEQAPAKS